MKHGPRKIGRSGAALAAIAMASTMPGCAVSGPGAAKPQGAAVHPAAFVGNQGGAWEVLFIPGGAVTAASTEGARRDEFLNIREAPPITMLGMWPEDPRPRLGHARRLFLPRRGNEVLYIDDRAPFHHHHRWWWY